MTDLKRENQTLKRKIAKLQKYTQKLLESVQLTPEEEAPQVVLDADTKAAVSDSCPSCLNKNLTHVTLPTGVMVACKSCGWRKKNVGTNVPVL